VAKRNIRVGDISEVSGQVNIAGRDNLSIAVMEGAQLIINQAQSLIDQAHAQERFEYEKLAHSVSHLAQKLRSQIEDQSPQGRHPFRYLLPYELADASYFFGRDNDLRNLLENLTCDDPVCRLGILHGYSGVGMTSLLRAGVIPMLIASQNFPLLIRVGPKSLVNDIKQVLLGNLERTPQLKNVPLKEFVRQVAGLLPEGKKVYVLLDQFELFFDMPQHLQKQFVDELADCISDVDDSSRWLIGVQSSFLGHLSTFQPAIPHPFINTNVLSPLSHDAAETVILESAKLANLTFDENLLNKMLDDLGGNTVDPSRLQIVCHTLVEGLEPEANHITISRYQDFGGVDKILQYHLDLVLSRNFMELDRKKAWQILASLSDEHDNSLSETNLIENMRLFGVNKDDTKRILNLLELNRLVGKRNQNYEIINKGVLPKIREWKRDQAASEKARLEIVRQIEKVRNSALRGMIGGSIGFSLGYLIAYFPETNNKFFLGFSMASRVLPGAFAGTLLILIVDIFMASYQKRHKRLRWVVGGFAGILSYGIAILIHVLLSVKQDASMLLRIMNGTLEGIIWGIVVGLGVIWIATRKTSWATIAFISTISGFILWSLNKFGHAFGDPSYSVVVFLSGLVMMWGVSVAAKAAGSKKYEEHN